MDPLLTDPDMGSSPGVTATTNPDRLTLPPLPNLAPIIVEPVAFWFDSTHFLSTNLIAIDPEANPLTWDITGGKDASRFSIYAETASLTLDTPFDIPLPQDADGDGTYEVNVRVTDAEGASSSTSVSFTVVTQMPPPPPPPRPVLRGQEYAGADQPSLIFLTADSAGMIGQVNLLDPAEDQFHFEIYGEDRDWFAFHQVSGGIELIQPLRNWRPALTVTSSTKYRSPPPMVADTGIFSASRY
ncbi:MAG: hypothetical protein AAGJ28_09340 [Pseudomonadota bacterium]